MRNAILLLSLVLFCFSCQNKNEKEDISLELQQKIQKYVEYWNTGQFEGIENILSESFEVRTTPDFAPELGIEAFNESILNIRKLYPDFHLTVDEELYTTNAAAARWTIQATSKTGEIIINKGMSIVHFVDGKIKDEWIANNDLNWLNQLGYTVLPPSTE